MCGIKLLGSKSAGGILVKVVDANLNKLAIISFLLIYNILFWLSNISSDFEEGSQQLIQPL